MQELFFLKSAVSRRESRLKRKPSNPSKPRSVFPIVHSIALSSFGRSSHTRGDFCRWNALSVATCCLRAHGRELRRGPRGGFPQIALSSDTVGVAEDFHPILQARHLLRKHSRSKVGGETPQDAGSRPLKLPYIPPCQMATVTREPSRTHAQCYQDSCMRLVTSVQFV